MGPETFEACLETARKRNVIYCIEPLSRTSTNFINTVEEALLMVKEIRHPNLKMVFDCRSATQEESVIGALLRALESRALYHVHVNDASGKGPGFGETRFTPSLKHSSPVGISATSPWRSSNTIPDPRPLRAGASAT